MKIRNLENGITVFNVDLEALLKAGKVDAYEKHSNRAAKLLSKPGVAFATVVGDWPKDRDQQVHEFPSWFRNLCGIPTMPGDAI